MMIKRIIATFLAALMLFASFAIVVNAEGTAAEEPVYEFNTAKDSPAMDYLTGKYTYKDENGKEVEEVVDTKEERLALMDLRLQKGDYRLYVDAYSGEVAVEKISTGDVMFTNPYSTSGSTMSEDKKARALSQLKIYYIDTKANDTPREYYSYTNAVKGGDHKNTAPSQLNVRYIKDGIRVDYSIGRTDSRYLVPERIEASVFKTQIYDVAIAAGCTDLEKMQLNSFYKKYDLDDPTSMAYKSDKIREQWLAQYPMLQKTVDGQTVNVPIYVFTGVAKPEYKAIEKIIKKYCPDFTYEELDNQHLALNYTPQDRTEALFKVALEYTLDDKGLSVRLPANGVRFDESLFRLEYIQILPYMGAGVNPNSGYTFFPDGSGTLFSFEKLAKLGAETSFFGTIYGEDFGYYHLASEGPHNEAVRYPVFGISETEKNKETGEEKDRGFVAIIEEGEAMTKLISYHSAEYNTVIMQANPRPSDQFMPSGASKPWTVVSERKYTGNFKIRYIMLSDEKTVAEKGGYEANYVGMAKAYRDHLTANGTLTRLTDADVKENLPIYIETFGAIETTKKFLSIPYKTNVALTSFADIKTMYEELSANGVDNINFILTGYSKGGLTNATIPYKLKWDKSVKKDYDFDQLLTDANGKFGVYPDFDFAFSSNNTLFDGLTLDKHAIKTIDGRYTSKREYSATRQTFINYYELAISPAYFNRFYETLTGEYLTTNPQGISVSTLGTYLSSDFDEDEPFNREDTKQFTSDAFKYFDEMYNRVITSGGNAFTWKYVDVITDISTDSSRHSRSAATVPFLGIVLHGFVETVSTPINMEGNIDYAMLRAIENGTSFKFMLSYDNTELLKEYTDTSVYYSIRYDIWLADLIRRYDEINRALKDVQTSTIEKHEFIEGIRIPENNELESDAEDALAAAIAKEKADAAIAKEELRVKLQLMRNELIKYNAIIDGTEDFGYNTAKEVFFNSMNVYSTLKETKAEKDEALENAKAAYDTANAEYEAAKAIADAEGATDEQKAAAEQAKTALDAAKATLDAAQTAADTAKAEEESALAKSRAAYIDFCEAAEKFVTAYENAETVYNQLKADFELFEINNAYTPAMIAELKAILDKLGNSIFDLKLVLVAENATINAYNEALEKYYPEVLSNDGVSGADPIPEPSTKVDAVEYNKYAAAESTIVYEQYSNGKTFVLNFNNFAVKVKINGVFYTVSAYGYIEIK